jgi:hypothetical protein
MLIISVGLHGGLGKSTLRRKLPSIAFFLSLNVHHHIIKILFLLMAFIFNKQLFVI